MCAIPVNVKNPSLNIVQNDVKNPVYIIEDDTMTRINTILIV